MSDSFFDSLLEGLDKDIFSSPRLKSSASSGVRTKPRAVRSPSSAHKRVALDPTGAEKSASASSGGRAARSSPQRPLASSGSTRQAAFDALCDGFDGFENEDDDLSMSPDEAQPAGPPVASWAGRKPRAPNHIPISRRYTRAIVESVELVGGDASRATRKHVFARVHGEKLLASVQLEDDWIQTRVEVDDVVHLIGDFEPAEADDTNLSMRVTRAKNFFIVQPDTLISATRTADAAQCPRKAVLQEKVRAPARASLPLVYGNILHAVLQTCLSSNTWHDDFRIEQIDKQVAAHAQSLWEAECDFEEARKTAIERSANFAPWAAKYMGDLIKPDARLTDPHGNGQEARLAVTGVHDIEEEILSPRFGMKGKVDASILARSMAPGLAGDGRELEPATRPFEIKTGRKIGVMEHRAQTMLYTLLMSERYDAEIEAGLLLYTHGTDLIQVQAARNELRGLVMARNELASHLHLPEPDHTFDEEADDAFEQAAITEPDAALPAPIDEERSCKRCYANDSCMLYRRVLGEGDISEDLEDPLQQVLEAKTSHLTDAHLGFFQHWERLLSMEEQDSVRYKKEIWTMSAEAREKAGRCFADMVVGESLSAAAGSFVYRLRKASSDTTNLLAGHMGINDAVCVSVSGGAYAVARGFIAELTTSSVTVRVDHALANLPCVTTDVNPVVFRVDKDELAAGLGRMRDNLARLFYGEGDEQTRRRVVDLELPCFRDETLPAEDFGALNDDQQAALAKVLAAEDYALILGMPGTGKTQTIAALLRHLVKQGKSVLLTSYTHSAVDNILLKVKDLGDDILRLGNADKVMPELRSLTLDSKPPVSSLSDLDERLLKPHVVATTALTVVSHSLFARRRFDICIVDEASQITLPACLGPLRFADRFVLVGDHNQLPPLVRNDSARREGYDVSLFRLLSEAHPQAVAYLSRQYRMNSEIMAISNRLVYHNRLRCGSEAIASRQVALPMWREVAASKRCPAWLKQALDPSRPVIFFDTDGIAARETRIGRLVHNTVEAHMIGKLARGLIDSGLPATELAILTPYRQQLKTIAQQTESLSSEIEIITADRSQGRDKDCVVLSMVRSNDRQRVGDLLRDWRRLNVCFTRARSKLIVYGSRETLKVVPELKTFFELADERGWTHRLHEEHKVLGSSSPRKPLSQVAINV